MVAVTSSGIHDVPFIVAASIWSEVVEAEVTTSFLQPWNIIADKTNSTIVEFSSYINFMQITMFKK
jgi:hypothetical protein